MPADIVDRCGVITDVIKNYFGTRRVRLLLIEEIFHYYNAAAVNNCNIDKELVVSKETVKNPSFSTTLL